MADGAVACVGIDPGWRIGIAWVADDGSLLRSLVVDRAGLNDVPLAEGPIVVGNGTGSAALQRALLDRGIVPIVVDEHGSTEEGRRLYWRDHPPTGWRRWIPPGLLVPPRDLDDYAAYAIALRHLEGRPKRSRRPRPVRGSKKERSASRTRFPANREGVS